jgi:hypothetical protein
LQKPSQNRQKIGQSWQKGAKRSKKEQKGAKEHGEKVAIFSSVCVLFVYWTRRAVHVPFVRDAQPVVVRGGEVFATAATVAQYIAHAAGAAVGFVGVVHHLESG